MANRSKKRCVDCGKALKFEPLLSNSKTPPNEFRTMVYSCQNCLKIDNVIKLFRIYRREDDSPLQTAYIEILQEKDRK